MKSLTLASIVLLLASAVSNADELKCNPGNGGYSIEYSLNAPLKSVRFTIFNASGVEDASGTIPCDGPDEAAYRCHGAIPTLAGNGTMTGPKRGVDTTIGEAAFGIGGPILVGGVVVPCSKE